MIANFVDLHCHLGGSTPPDILKSIAYNRGLSIFPKNWHEFNCLIRCGEINSNHFINDKYGELKKYEEFKKYLSRYKMIQKITSSPEAIRESVFWSLRTAFLDYDTNHIEMKLNPMLRNEEGIYDVDSIISAACDGLDKAKNIFGMKCGIIIESDRSFNPELSLILAKKAIKFRERGVVGFDISGFDDNFSINDHINSFRLSKDHGLGVTYHSNEHKIEDDILDFNITKYIDRIGHGVKIIKFNNRLEQILENNPTIVFELCPYSNITSGVETVNTLIVMKNKLKQKGVRYCICTDGFIFNLSVQNNMKLLNLTDTEQFELNEKTKNYSFIK